MANQFARQLCLSSFPPNPQNFKSLCSNGQLREALLEMAAIGLEMKFDGYYTLLNECVNRKAFREGQRVHAHMIRTCYLPPVHLGTRLIIFYNYCDCLGDAGRTLDEMPERNVVSWTAMVSAYSKRRYASEALKLLVQMLRSGMEPNEFTFVTIITSCTGALGLDLGRKIHSLIIRRNFESHIFVGSSLLDMYAKAGRIYEAQGVFDCLSERDVVSCTAIISGYAQLGPDEEALELLRQLQREGMTSNYVTYASVSTALSGLAELDLGRQVHSHILCRELPSYVVLLNSLIDMYSKCGNLSYSRRIFDSMTERTIISWNAMLVGYSKHGMGKEVVKLFKLMKEENKVRPDSVTFLVVLFGCSHGGMKEGWNSFMRWKKVKMESSQSLNTLGVSLIFLGVLIEPENAGNYVILSNLYASTGRWEDARIIRELMLEKVVIREPGRNWIELDLILHTFHASDCSHERIIN
ncbi:putative pentatricopeptide repeat-containing protein At3g13770, mitochondrial [Pyrus x bretschneideri]|uniref:putative pentatricopeptide repeat-containing protein At3g13770, mitochondrial n=1 Tax=Pyrus x bretschneideri TaxID=225117 RepID=UPI002030D636|nr:putative pentatricopeptide repeat-containing protein At3g13770, mitochondrial [Pyrus x bretschneideri]